MSVFLPPDTKPSHSDLPSASAFISAREAAKLLGISGQTLRRWEKQGIVVSERPNGKTRQYKKSDIEKLRDTRPLTIAEAATFLGISVSTLRRLEKRGKLVPDRADRGERRYSQAVLRAYRDGTPLSVVIPSSPLRETKTPFLEADDEVAIPIKASKKNTGSTKKRAAHTTPPQTLPIDHGLSRPKPHSQKVRETLPAPRPSDYYRSLGATEKRVVSGKNVSRTALSSSASDPTSKKANLALAPLPAVPAGERVRQSRIRQLKWQSAVALLGMPILSTRLSTVTTLVIGLLALSAIMLVGLRHFFGRKKAGAALKELYLPSAGTAFAGSAATAATGEVLLPYRTYTLLRRRLLSSLISSVVVAVVVVIGLRTLPVPAYFLLGPLLLWFLAAGLYSLISLLRLTPSGQRFSTLKALFTTDPRQIFARYAKTGEGGALEVGYTSYKRTYRMATTAIVVTIMLASGGLLLALLQARSTADDNIGAALTQFGRVTDTLRTGQGNLREELQKLAAQSLQPAPTVDENTLFDRLVARVLEQLPAPPEQIVREETEIRVIERTEIQPGTIESIEIAQGSKFVVKDYNGTTFVTFDSTRTLTLEEAGIFNIEGIWQIEGAEVTASAAELNRTTKLDDTGAGSEGARQIGTRADNFTNFSSVRNDVEAALAAIDTAFGSGAVGADTLDFTEFEDTMDLDADLAVNTTGFDVVFNEDGADSDFRVEGDTNANLFFVDASTDRVGIGTTTPGRTLHVFGSQLIERNTAHPHLVLRGFNATKDWWLAVDESDGSFRLQESSTGAGILRIESGAPGSTIFVQSSGNVGIGTTGPDRTLDVLHASSPQLRLTQADGTVYAEAQTNSSGNLAFTTTGTSVTFTSDDVTVGGDNLNVNGLTYAWPATHTTDGVLSNNGSGSLTWATLGAAAVTPDSLDFSEFQDTMDLDANLAVNTTGFDVVWNEDGGDSDFRIEGDTDANLFFVDASADRIGVGTASPAQTLHVNNAGGAGIQISDSGSSVGDGSGIEFNYFGGSATNFRIARILPYTQAGGGGDLLFQTAASATASYDTKMVLTRSGLVSIGATADTTPDASLEVINDGSGDSFLVADTNDGDTSPFVIDSTGEVGIGNTTPTTTLHIGSGATLTIPDGAGAGFTPQVFLSRTTGVAGIGVGVNDGTNNRRAGLFVDQTNGIWGLGSTYSTGGIPFVISQGTVERLRLTDSGDLQFDGDLTISGDDLFMGTNTSGFILVADGTNYNPVAMSGDATLASTGALTISSSAVGSSEVTDDSLDYVDFEDTMDLDAALTLNQTTNTWSQTFTGDTTTGFGYAANSLTTGKALNITSSSGVITSGELLTTALTSSGSSLAAKTGNLSSISSSRTETRTTGTTADDYDVLNLTRTNVINGAGGTLTAAGSVLRLENVATQTAGTLTDTTKGLEVVMDTDGTGDAVFIDSNAAAAIALNIDAENTTADAVNIDTTATSGIGLDVVASSLTSGSGLRVYSNSASASARSLLFVHNDNISATGTQALLVQQDAAGVGVVIDQNGEARALYIDAENTAADIVDIDGTQLTTGDALQISLDSDNATTGQAIRVFSGATASTQVFSVDEDGDTVMAGDLTISGDDLFMATNTSGHILVADGTNFNPVAMSGDITIDSTGATAIGADKVTEADLKAVDAAADEECLTYESTVGDFEWQSCIGSGMTSFTLAGDTGVSQTISEGNTLTVATGAGLTATAGATDTVTITVDDDGLDFAQFEDTMDLDAALTLNQTTNTWTQNFTGDTTTGLTYNANSLTTGKALNITSSSGVITSGELFTTALTSSGSLTAKSGNLTSVAGSRTNTATIGTVADDYDLLGLTRTSVQNGTGGTLTAAGSVLRLENVATQTAGTLTDTTKGLEIVMDADGTGDGIFIDSNSTTGIALNIDAESTTGIITHIDATPLTTGVALNIANLSSITTGDGINVTSASSTVTSGELFSALLTTSAASPADKTGSVTSIDARRVKSGTSGTTADDFDVLGIYRTSQTTGAGGALTAAGSVLRLENIATQTAGTLTDSARVLEIVQDADSSGDALAIAHAGTGYALRVNDDGTLSDATPLIVEADGDVGIGTTSVTTGHLLDVRGNVRVGTGTDVAASRSAITFNNGGYAAPAAPGSTSTGDKLVLYDPGSLYRHVIGTNTAGQLWFQSYGDASGGFSWYTGATPTEIAVLGGTGNLQIDGDLTISGDDLVMGTNTSGHILVADGTNYNPVAMSGDITITSTGATSIGADKVLEADLKAVDTAVDEECLTYETTTGDFEWQDCSASIAADSLDFDDFEDTMDLDAALTLNQGTNTWTQSFTGTTTDGFTYSATSLTSGTGLDVNVTNTHTADAAIEQVQFDLTNAQSTAANTNFAGVTINFTNNPTIAGNTENVVRIQNQVTTNATDNAVAALLRLDNADTSTTGSTVVTDAIRITNSGDIAGGITNGINFDDTDITNDIVLQNDLIIQGNTAGEINFTTSGGLPLFTTTVAGSVGNGTFTGDLTVTGNNLAFGNGEFINNDTNGTLALVGNVGIAATAITAEALLEVQGAEATDAIIALDADDGDDLADTWFLESEAADNDLSFVNNTTEALKLTSGGNLTTTGDLTITGDDLFMTTNTSGFILVADGTNFNPVAMSGDATLSSAGALTIDADEIDFDQMEDTMDLDAALVLNQTTNTWSQIFTGTTTTGLAYSATSLTTGQAFELTALNTATANTAIEQVEFILTNNQNTAANTNFAGLAIDFSSTPGVAGNTENVVRIQNQVTTNTVDTAVATLLRLDNADTSAFGSTVITDALLITNSGDIAGGITNAINIDDTDVTNDIVLQNDEVIQNNTDGTVIISDGSNALLTITDFGLSGVITAGSGLLVNNTDTTDGNVSIGGGLLSTGLRSGIAIVSSTAPTSSPTNGVQLWAEDVGGLGHELRVRDEAGNVTTLSPHNFSLFTPDEDYILPWSFYSKNDEAGKEINVDMYGAIAAIELLSGRQFIYAQELESGASVRPPVDGTTSLIARFDRLEERVAGIESERSLLEAATAAAPTPPPPPTLPTNVLTDSVFSDELVFTGALTAENTVTITGPVQVTTDLSVLGDLVADTIRVAQALTVEGDTTIFGTLTAKSDVAVEGTLSLSEQQGGYATVRKFSRTVTIPFSKPFLAPPLVTANALSGFVEHRIADISPTSFTIELASSAEGDLTFSWVALAVTNPTTTIGEEGVPPEPPAEAIEPAAAPAEDEAPSETAPVGPVEPPAAAPVAPTPVPSVAEPVPVPSVAPAGEIIAAPAPEPSVSEG